MKPGTHSPYLTFLSICINIIVFEGIQNEMVKSKKENTINLLSSVVVIFPPIC